MRAHAATPMWDLGSQPILLLLAAGRWRHLPAQWNFDGLGYKDRLPATQLQKASVLHWNGRDKPWLTCE